MVMDATIPQNPDNTYAFINHEGSVTLVTFFLHTTSCVFELIKFPFDEQLCYIIVTAQNAVSQQVTLNPTAVVHRFAEKHAQWEILDISALSAEEEDGVDDNMSIAAAFIGIRVARLPSFYVQNIILPLFILGLIGLGAFMIPLKSGERASVCISVVLGITIFQVVLSDVLPRTSRPDQMPILYSYGSRSFTLLVSLTMASFFNIWLCSLSGNLRWKFVRILFFKVLAVAVLLGKEGRRNMRKYSGKT